LTSAGRVTRRRRHLACPDCGGPGYGIDEALGLDGYLSRRLRRLACFAASDGSFAQAAESLRAYCRLEVSAETLRVHCEREGRRMAAWQPASAAVAAAFARAEGAVAFQLDAGKANTRQGWRAVKLAVLAKRPLGPPAGVAAWESRALPPLTARTMCAALEPIEEFQQRWRPQAVHLGIADPAAIHCLGDGAEWIWNAVDSHFPGGPPTLDS
jgi:hypothetical protein